MASAADAPALQLRRDDATGALPSRPRSWSCSWSRRRSCSIRSFSMKALCFALFACAFNLLIGYVGLLSFGHALYFGWASYLVRLCRQGLGLADRSSPC